MTSYAFQPYNSAFSVIDLSTLAAPAMVEQAEYTDIFSEMLRDFVRRDPTYTVLLESDPAPKILEVQSYREQILRQNFNDRSLQQLLAYAKGTNLDHLGSFFGVTRGIVDQSVRTDIDLFNTTPAVVYENDTDFRKRIQQAPEAWSNAGTPGGYTYHAYTAAPGLLEDVALYNSSSGLVGAGSVLVVLLVRDNQDKTAVLAKVKERLFRDDIKPLTDDVRLLVATPSPFDIAASVYVKEGPDPAVIRTQIRTRINEYLASRRKVGLRVAASGIIAAIQGQYVEYIVPASDTVLPGQDILPAKTSYAVLRNLTLNLQPVSRV